MNTIGTIYRITTFGESHGPAVGGVIDGVPAGITIDFDAVAAQLARRRPGQSALTTARKESDAAEFLSGFLGNTTLGSPIGFIIRNSDTRSSDYDNMARLYRPNHADCKIRHSRPSRWRPFVRPRYSPARRGRSDCAASAGAARHRGTSLSGGNRRHTRHN